MSFESPDNEKNFPGLYKAGSLSDQASVTEEDHDKSSKKKDLGKKKDGKKDKKEKGYMMFEEEDSEEDLVSLDDVKSPSKVKKSKAGFKFPARKDIFPKKEKDDKKEKETKKEEKKKEEKEGKKHKLKEKKKSKHPHHDVTVTVVAPNEYEKPIFGVPLAMSVERNKSHDGIELPAIFRECVDYIEEYGLSCEGIYRISGVKSKVQHLKDCYNKGVPVYLQDHEPNVVASLLKQFLRDLPEPVLTTALMPKFEEASTIKNEKKRIEQFRKLIDELPTPNRLLLSWMIVHMSHIIELQKENKMTLQNVSIVLSPTMQISHRVLNILFTYAAQLFADTIVKRYVPPLKPATSRWSLELPDSPAALEEELAKQESLLNQLHGELNAGVTDSAKEEQLWEVQRVVTQLKRKIKFAKKSVEKAAEKRRKDIESKKLSTHLPEEEELDLTPKKPEPKTKKSASKEGTPEVEKAEKAEESKVKDETKSENEVAEQKEAESQNEATSQKEAETQKEDKEEDEKKRNSLTEKGGVQVTVKADVVKSAEQEPEPKEESPEKESSEKVTDTGEKREDEKTKPKEEKKEVKESEVKKKKKTEKVSLHPHIHLTSEPLQPIKAEQPVVSRREEFQEDSLRKSVELRELEEEFLGDGKTEKRVKFSEQPKERVVEEEPEIEETEEEVFEEETVWAPIDDEEMQKLMEEEEAMKMEEEELLAIGDELRQKIETEQSEIERLHQEIQELHYLRQDSDLEDLSSSSESSYDSEDEEDLQDILSQLITENEDLEKKNAELCQKIHEERMICLSVKLQIRLLQQKQLETSQSSVGGADRETFL